MNKNVKFSVDRAARYLQITKHIKFCLFLCHEAANAGACNTH